MARRRKFADGLRVGGSAGILEAVGLKARNILVIMGTSPISVLFVGHSATRSGAPIALLRFMRWFREFGGGPFSCLLKNGGELQGEFAQLCPTSILKNSIWWEDRLSRRMLRKAGLGGVGRWLHGHSVMGGQIAAPDLIYCNTVAALPALELAAKRKCRILCHVHELEFSFHAGDGPASSQRVLELCDRVIACSQAVAANLIERHRVPPDRVDVVHEFVLTAEAAGRGAAEGRRWLREKLGLAPDAYIVGAAGALEWRKGADLFVQLAALLERKKGAREVHFVWLGGDSALESAKFLHDVALTNLTKRVTLIASQPEPMRYFGGFDLLVLPSREDPFPLVCLEAAACGCPIICFDRAGGMPEFVEDDCGAVVPYLDLETMAAEILRYQADPELRFRQGRAALEKVRVRHDISVAAPQLLEIMRRTAAMKGPGNGAAWAG